MAASPDKIALTPRRLVIMVLTRRELPNAALWRQWARGQPISFVLNAKYLGKKEGGERGGLPMRINTQFGGLTGADRVVDTKWGSHGVCIAHQAMLRVALERHPDAAWFQLVSGDSVPLITAARLMRELNSLGTQHSLIGRFEETWMAECLQTNAQLCQDATNWWVKHAAQLATDAVVHEHGQFVLFCRSHAHAFADMPAKVLMDYDAVLDIDAVKGKSKAQKLVFSADEVVPLAYLSFLGFGDHLLDIDSMMAPAVGEHAQNFKGRVPVRKITFATEIDGLAAFFLRKITEPLTKAEQTRLKGVWKTRPRVFEPERPRKHTLPPARASLSRGCKRQRIG